VHETVQQLTVENKNYVELVEKNTKEGDYIRAEARKIQEEHEELMKNNVIEKIVLIYSFCFV